MSSSIMIDFAPPILTSGVPSTQSNLGAIWSNFYAWPRLQRHRPMTAEATIAEQTLSEISRLPANWDGYGGVPIATSTVENARSALLSLLRDLPLPDVTPNANGTISFEWESASFVAGLEIGATRFSFFLRPRFGGSTYAEGDASLVSQHSIGPLIASHLFPFDRDRMSTSGFRFAGPHVQAA